MNLTEITRIANNYTDEQFSTTITMDFANEGIAKVNAELSVNLPFFTNNTTDYTALPSTWLRLVIVPYVSYSIKVNDGSINEASAALYERFERGMKDLKRNRNKAISLEYRVQWIEASVIDFEKSNNPIIYYTGTCNSYPSMAFLTTPASVSFGTVAKVVTGTAEEKCVDEQVKYYKLSETGGAVKLSPLGSNNAGWF